MTAVAVALLVWSSVTAVSASTAGRLRRSTARAGSGGRNRGRRPLRRRPQRGRPEPDPALVLDLVAAGLTAGSPPHVALAVVGGSVGGRLGEGLTRVAARLRLGSPWEQAWSGTPSSLDVLRRTLALASATGAPGAALLRDAAGDLRRRRLRDAQADAARLGVRMVLPLGLCALPAFVVWAVVPLVLSLAGRVLDGAP